MPPPTISSPSVVRSPLDVKMMTALRRRRTKSWHQLPWTATVDMPTRQRFDEWRRRWHSADPTFDLTPMQRAKAELRDLRTGRFKFIVVIKDGSGSLFRSKLYFKNSNCVFVVLVFF